MRYLIAYDVAHDANRTKLANLLLDHGDRVQQSVFEAELSGAELQGMLGIAAKYIGDDDSLRAYPLLCGLRARGNRDRPARPLG